MISYASKYILWCGELAYFSIHKVFPSSSPNGSGAIKLLGGPQISNNNYFIYKFVHYLRCSTQRIHTFKKKTTQFKPNIKIETYSGAVELYGQNLNSKFMLKSKTNII